MLPSLSNVGSYLKARSGAIVPNDRAAGAVNGTGVDRLNPEFMSALLVAQSGAASGSPTAVSLDAKIQHSDDNSTWSDLSGASITQITAENTAARKAVDLSGAKRYVRVVLTPGFTGGTSPKIGCSALLVLGGAKSLPTSD